MQAPTIDEVFADPGIDAVLIATRHHLHAAMVEAALRAGKHVFVEKPLALTQEELAARAPSGRARRLPQAVRSFLSGSIVATRRMLFVCVS